MWLKNAKHVKIPYIPMKVRCKREVSDVRVQASCATTMHHDMHAKTLCIKRDGDIMYVQREIESNTGWWFEPL